DENSSVRINISNGPKDVGVPDVRGQAYDSAASALQAQGFAVARNDVQSDQTAGIVIDQSPAGNTFATPGSTITLTVSKGPATNTVPGVENRDVQTAKSTLAASGFKAHVVMQDTSDPTLDGIVISQNPTSGTQARPGTTITLVVGKYRQQAPPPPPPPATT